MFNREYVEQQLKELEIPVDKFYEEGNHLSFGGFRGTQKTTTVAKIFGGRLHYEPIDVDNLTDEEWCETIRKIKDNSHVVGWFILNGMHPNIWYALDDETDGAAELVGGLLKFIQLN